MTIEIKRSIKPIEYDAAISYLEDRSSKIVNNKSRELIWILEHPSIFTAGKSYIKKDIVDQSIKIVETKRGGKITYHGPGQLICYFVIDLNKRKKDIRKFVKTIEKTIIESLSEYNIKSHSDRKNIGIWTMHKKKIKKIAAIGIRVKRWVAFHGFAINVNTDLTNFKKIIPCGIKDKEVVNLIDIKKRDYSSLKEKIVTNFIKNFET